MSTERLPRGRQAGLTLVELVLFIVVVSVAVVGVLGVMNYTAQRSADPIQHKQALLIAEALVEEVSLAHFTFCHPDDANAETATSAAACATTPEAVGAGGGTRPYFNVNDYVPAFNVPTSFTAGDTTGTITDVTGVRLYGNDYKAKVTIVPNASLGPAGRVIVGAATANTDLLHISVRVDYGSGQSVTLDRYRTRYAPNSMP